MIKRTVLFSFVLLGVVFAQSSMTERFKNIGDMIRNVLQEYHFRKIPLDDQVSQKAFSEYLKKIDYSKQFLLKADVKKLEKHQFLMDDQLRKGKYTLVEETISMFRARIKEVQKIKEEIFKEQFTFKSKEKFETDPEKRDYPDNQKALKEVWRKSLKQATLTRYLTIKEEQEGLKKTKVNKKDKKKVKKPKILTEKEILKKAHDAISKKYGDFYNRLLKDKYEDYLEKYYNSIAAIYGPHTAYLPPKKKEDFDIDISGSLEGIGAVLSEDGSYIKVVRIVPGGAAWSQKDLEVDDVILAVGEGDDDPVDLVDMRVDDAVRYIRGKKGTEVRLTVKKVDGTIKVIPIVRDVVQVEASYAKASILEDKKLGVRAGYIHVPKFYRDFGNSEKNCTVDVRNELMRLKKQDIHGVILDLRNNGGGALEDAKQMSGLFIEKGPIVQVKNTTGQVDILRDLDKSVTYDGPLIVLVNRFSASASEILAGAMQDYGRAIVVGGEFTHGKGTVQAIFNFDNQRQLLSLFGPNLGALKLTIQKFYRVSGASTQYRGITPDIILPDPFGYAKSREQDLEYSLPWDKVASVSFKPWQKFSYDIKSLKQRSEKRIEKSDKFKKIIESVAYLQKRREETVMELNIEAVKREEAENKKMTEKFKMEEENKSINVSHYEQSLRSHEKVRPGEEEQWKKDFEKRKEDYVSGIRKDPILEESLAILSDFLKSEAGQKLTMAGKKKK